VPQSPESLEVRSPHDGRVVAEVPFATEAEVETAVAAAHAARGQTAAAPAHVRAAALTHISDQLEARADEVAALITAESGKPLKWSVAEASRGVSTFRWAAEEARRWSGEVQRLDTEPAATGRMAVVRRFPRGPVLGISPFNFPLNLVAHKVAPAIAVGAPIIVKPAPKTPLTALLLAEIMAETELPEGAASVLLVPDDRAAALVADPRLPVVSFTGSSPVGYAIREAVPHKHVTLELGGNAAALVCADWSSSDDLDWAAQRIATFGMYQAGQSCISVQRVLADTSVYDDLVARLVAATEALVVGDPADPATDVGPLINEASALRVGEWVDEAVAAGAKVRTGGRRHGTSYAPTVLTDVPADARVAAGEVFGPVVLLSRVEGADAGLRAINDSRFGLQAGIFTHDVQLAFRAHRELEVGGVVVGDVPSYRADQMPYGGAKESGVGREGVRYAMEDLTYERVLVLTGLDL
jgi:acyl-CoA reductase-like NAD-dependent aldehyde dehydrogenase